MENYSTPYLSSGRLTYTRARMEDTEAMFNGWGGNPKVARYMMFRPMSPEECEQHIAGVIEAYEAGGNQDHWIIRKDGDGIGEIILTIFAQHNSASVAYLLSEEYWGMGYMTEALRTVIRFGFEVRGLNRICASHFRENGASGRVMEKAGMVFEGIEREKYLKDGVYYDAAGYAILRREYEKGGDKHGE